MKKLILSLLVIISIQCNAAVGEGSSGVSAVGEGSSGVSAVGEGSSGVSAVGEGSSGISLIGGDITALGNGLFQVCIQTSETTISCAITNII